MHRNELLGLLEEYAERYPGEGATLERFRTFVRSHKRCFERDCWAGHVTGSAWLVNSDRDQGLLTHHKKLDRIGLYIVLVKNTSVKKQGNHSATHRKPLQSFAVLAEGENGQPRAQPGH